MRSMARLSVPAPGSKRPRLPTKTMASPSAVPSSRTKPFMSSVTRSRLHHRPLSVATDPPMLGCAGCGPTQQCRATSTELMLPVRRHSYDASAGPSMSADGWEVVHHSRPSADNASLSPEHAESPVTAIRASWLDSSISSLLLPGCERSAAAQPSIEVPWQRLRGR